MRSLAPRPPSPQSSRAGPPAGVRRATRHSSFCLRQALSGSKSAPGAAWGSQSALTRGPQLPMRPRAWHRRLCHHRSSPSSTSVSAAMPWIHSPQQHDRGTSMSASRQASEPRRAQIAASGAGGIAWAGAPAPVLGASPPMSRRYRAHNFLDDDTEHARQNISSSLCERYRGGPHRVELTPLSRARRARRAPPSCAR